MKRFVIPSLAVGVLMVGASQAQAARVTIDSFDDGSQNLSATTGTVSGSALGSASEIIGGERDIQLTILQNLFGRRLNTEVDVLPPPPRPGVLAISNDTEVQSETLITWDGVAGSGLNLDLTGGGMNKFFRFDLISVDLSAVLTLSVMDNSGNTATLAQNVPTTFEETSVFFNFNTFDNAMGTNFSNVKSISLQVTGPANFDLVADSLVADVPEPLTILGSGLALGFGAMFKKEYSRKQKKHQQKN